MINKWIAHERYSAEAEMNLFCFSFPGGSASYFAPWKKLIDSRINVLPVLYPQRETRAKEKMHRNLEEFVKDFVETNKELLSKPYAFFGYCGGAVVAYDCCRYAASLGLAQPLFGVAASSEAPEYLKDTLPEVDEGESYDKIKEYLTGLEIFDKAMLENDLFLRYYLPMLKADCDLYRTYDYKQFRLSSELIIMRAVDDKSVSEEKAGEWRNVADSDISQITVEGGHFFVDKKTDMVCELINKKFIDRR